MVSYIQVHSICHPINRDSIAYGTQTQIKCFHLASFAAYAPIYLICMKYVNYESISEIPLNSCVGYDHSHIFVFICNLLFSVQMCTSTHKYAEASKQKLIVFNEWKLIGLDDYRKQQKNSIDTILFLWGVCVCVCLYQIYSKKTIIFA